MNDVDEYFRESEGEGIDDDNFTNLGSGTGFFQGNDFAASIPEFEIPEFEIPEFEIPEFETPEFEIPEFETPEFEIPEFEIPEFDVNNLGLTSIQDLSGRVGFGGFNNSFLTDTVDLDSSLTNTVDLNFSLTNTVDLTQLLFINDFKKPDYLVFDTEYYLEQNTEISSSSDSAFQHFLDFGVAQEKEYRYQLSIDYTPPEGETISNNEGIAQNYVLSGDLSNLEAFLTNNGDLLAFDTSYYLSQNSDVFAAREDLDPLLHFSQIGLKENREHRYTFVDNLLADNSAVDTNQSQDLLFTGEGNTIGFDPNFNLNFTFNSQYYLGENPDVAAAGIDPYEHYITSGIAEGLSPNAYYDLFPPSTFGSETTNIFDSSNNSFPPDLIID